MNPMLIGLALQVGAGIVGEIQSARSKEEADAVIKKALARFTMIPEPLLREVVAEQLGASEAGGVVADPAMKAAQMNALSKLQGIEQAGGLTLADQAVAKRAMDEAARRESAGRAQIAAQMQARGMANSGAELAMQLQNQQGAADRYSQSSMDMAAAAQKRYLDSILQRGHMAGQMRSQDFGERFQTAQARDAINRYNADSRSKAGYYNAGLDQQRFANAMQKQGAMAGLETGQFNAARQDVADERKFWNNLGVAGYEAFKPQRGQYGYNYDDDEDKDTWMTRGKAKGYI